GQRKDSSAAWTAIVGQTAQRVMDVFFSLCVEMRREMWHEEDFAIATVVRREINSIIQMRNRIAHDLWASGSPREEQTLHADAFRIHYSISPKVGSSETLEPISAQALGELAEEVMHLRDVVNFLGMHVFAEPPSPPPAEWGPRTFLCINEDGRVVRKS
ncbi:MAG TPA: hypothetical protein VK002_03810, partial [Rubricoccaceae bacterium]|nr:hypothetical protein [Rubricoccaceae bacterium]